MSLTSTFVDPPEAVSLDKDQSIALLLKEVESLKNVSRRLEADVSYLKAELRAVSAQQFQAAIQHEVGGTDA